MQLCTITSGKNKNMLYLKKHMCYLENIAVLINVSSSSEHQRAQI